LPDLRKVIHLVGSIPLENTENVLRTVSSSLGTHLCRIPDGETGKRLNWIKFLEDYLKNQHPDMEIDTDTPLLQWRQWDGQLLREIPMAKFKDGVNPKLVIFDTGYAEDAICSFSTFDKLQSEGVIGQNIKFQICIPTPLAPTYNFVAPQTQDDFIPAYTKHIVDEIAEISNTLPNDRISIQWDVCQEVLMWENYYNYERPGCREEIFSVLSAIGDSVPEPIELGYHLCYGSPRDEHLIQPKDTANMVEMTLGISRSVKRSIQFFHLPVPKDRDDDAYFEPLRNLNLSKGTELYLGLVHFDDQEGDVRRLKAAQKFIKVDGVGSECGWGRGDPKRVPRLLESHVHAINALQ